jgi:hypothetical protein
MNHASKFFHQRKHLETTFKMSILQPIVLLTLSKTERRYVTTTDGKKMLVWVVLPHENATKKLTTSLVIV